MEIIKHEMKTVSHSAFQESVVQIVAKYIYASRTQEI